MYCLGIESTAHTFGVGIVDGKGNVLANERDSFFPDRGIHPREAAEHHGKVAKDVIKKALKTAKLKLKDIKLISFSRGPGIPPCLLVGGTVARALSVAHDIPLVGVNHCIAHIEIGKVATGSKDPIVIFVSGGNSQVIGYAGGKYRIFGETLDNAVGNAIDKFARELGLGFPGGPKVQELAEKGTFVPMPYTVKGMDFSFAGLLTDAIRKHKSGDYKVEDLCFSFQETAYAMLAEATERAVSHTEKKEVLLTGGVAASKRFREMLQTMCDERGAKFFVVPIELSGDNGAMIAWQGVLEYKAKGADKPEETDFLRNWRVDDVEAKWIK